MSKLPSNIVSPRSTRSAIRGHCLLILATGGLLVFGFGTMAATMDLSGAVLASGTVVVKSSVKKVSHPTGGIVGRLLVDEGTHVHKGDVLVHLDETVAAATVDALARDFSELEAQRARLEAEAAGAEQVVFDRDIVAAAAGNPGIARIMTGEAKLFALRRSAREGQKKQMAERIAQLGNEIEALRQQQHAKDEELSIVRKELDAVQQLYDRSLVQLPRVDALKRDVARISGEGGALTAEIAQAEGKIAETKLQIIQIDADMRSDVGRQLGEIRAKTSDVTGRRIAAEDQLQHLDIRAPQDGVVHELAVHAKGAVISAGEPILLIVPDRDRLVAEVRVAPNDIDKVGPDQPAILRFPSFNQRTTPEVDAHVTRIAADTSSDPHGTPYYLVQIALAADATVAGTTLKPGMPVDAYIETGERTMLSYLMKPLSDQMSRAFREK
jgi:HlyD family secretion protein